MACNAWLLPPEKVKFVERSTPVPLQLTETKRFVPGRRGSEAVRLLSTTLLVAKVAGKAGTKTKEARGSTNTRKGTSDKGL
jgi:hypothetical protein